MVIGMVAALGIIGTGFAGTQPGLDLSPSEGAPGTSVTADQTAPVDQRCPIGSVTFGETPVDSSSHGVGQATFTVPPVDPDNYRVTLTCDDDSFAGSATFTVVDGATTTSVTVVPPPPDDSPPTTAPSEPTVTTAPGEPPPGGPGPTATTVPPPPATIEECEEQAAASESQLVYEPERQMVVGRSHDIQAALSLDALPPDVTFQSPTTIELVPNARCSVEAILTGADFDITPDEPRRQAFLDTRVLVWEWQVSPKRPGDDLKLKLRLQAIIFEDGRTVPGREILKETAIQVDAAPVSLQNRLNDFSRSAFGHPIVPIIVVPGVGAAYVWLRRRYGHKQPPPATESQAPPAAPS